MHSSNPYNLRPRKPTCRKKQIPIPKLGDIVSIYWEDRDKEYQGELKEFDHLNKRFLVDYDKNPDEYEDNLLIWEYLDKVPWRYVKRRKEIGGSRSTLRLRKPRHDKDGDDNMGSSPERASIFSDYFEPGELSAAHPEFCSPQKGRYGRKRRKITKMRKDDSYRGTSDDEEFIERDGDEKEDDVEDEYNGERHDEDNEEMSDELGEHRLRQEDGNRTAVSMDPKRKNNRRNRKYANFGEAGFKGNGTFTGVARVNGSSNESRCFGNDTIQVNCLRDLEGPSTVRGGSDESKRSNAFFVSTGTHIVPPLVFEGHSIIVPPSDEDQIRSITRSMGFSEENRFANDEA